MKLTASFLLVCCLQVAANGVAQTVTFSGRNVSIEKVFSAVEDQTGYFVVWNYQLLANSRPVTTAAKNRPLEDFLKEILKDQQLNFIIKDKSIFISSGGSAAARNSEKSVNAVAIPLPPPITVTGKVLNSNGEPEQGATITVKGTKVGTATNANGEFILNNVDETAILVVSGVNMETKEVRVSSGPMSITISTAVNSLEETVVIGYGTQKKVSLTGAVSSAKGTDIRRSPATNLSNNLAGRLPGLTAVTSSGEPGNDDALLRIRGSNTLGDNSPLIVVDGIANRTVSRLNPADIESITILKDASAAIYGAQAANGVILVTTRRGKSGKPRLTFNINSGLNQPTRIPEMADAAQFASMMNEMSFYANESAGRYQKYTKEDIQKYGDGSDPWGHPNTNWFRTVFKPWSTQSYQNATLTGGTENLRYFLSFGNRGEDGYYRNSSTRFNQQDFRSNIDAKVSKNISVALDVSGSEELRHGPIRGSGAIFRSLLRGHPIAPAFWPDGNPGPDFQEFGEQPAVTSTDATGYDRNNWYRLRTNARINVIVPWVKGLTLTGNASFDKDFNFEKKFEKPWYLYNWDGNADHKTTPSMSGLLTPQLTEWTNDGKRTTLNFYATYEKSINDLHNIKIMAGTEKQNGNTDFFSAFRKNFISSQIDQLFAGATDQFLTNDGNGTENARLNYFGRVNYDFNQKYLLEFVWRYDGSYMFQKGKQFGFFPGLSAGWRISKEKFWADNIKLFDDFKIRASWGQTGNDRIAEFQYLSTYGLVNNSWYVFNISDIQKMLAEQQIPNPNVTWEKANQSNVGFDLQMLNNKLSIVADYFSNLRSNILFKRDAAVPGSAGLSLPPENIGKVSNRGFEVAVSYHNNAGKLQYNVSVNGSYSKNKIVYWAETPGVPEYQKSTGQPMGSSLYYQAIGIFQDQAAVDAYPHWANARPGDVIFKDVNNDGFIDGLDRVRDAKSDMPRFTGGFNISLQYANFDLSILIQGAIGSQRYISTESGTGGNYYKEFADNRWTPENTNTSYARAWDFQTEYWATQPNTYWLRSTDYARLKNLELGYTLPAKVFGSVQVDNLRFFINGLNLATLSKSKLIDPEVANGQTYPLQRIINGGLSLTF